MDLAIILMALAGVLAILLLSLVAFLGGGRIIRIIRKRRGRPGVPLVLTPRFSPVGPDFQGSDEHWLDLAAEVCQQHNRCLGVIALRVLDLDYPPVAPAARDLADFTAVLSREFATVLRPSDMISARHDGEIVVGVPFVLEKSQIEGIANRLRRVFERVAESSGMKAHGDFGVSIYPMDGESGGELIQTALSDADRGSKPSRGEGPRLAGPRVLIGAAN